MLCADLAPDTGGHRPHHQSDGVPGALQGLPPRGEEPAFHDGDLLRGRLPQQHPLQLLPEPAAGADLHQLGAGVLRQRLLQPGAPRLCFCSRLCCLVFFIVMLTVLFFTPPDGATRYAEMEGERGGTWR